MTKEGGTKVLSIGGDSAPKPTVTKTKEGGTKVLSIGGDDPKP